jgi:hypothetical protein
VYVKRDVDGRATLECFERWREPAPVQDWRVDAARQLAKLVHGRRQTVGDTTDVGAS